MCLFNKEFQPCNLDAEGFKQFVLHSLRACAVDTTQPGHWSAVARADDGQGVSRRQLGRAVAPTLNELGAVLTPKLLQRMVAMYVIHGPELADDLKYANRETGEATNG